MADLDWPLALSGGILIGLSATLLLAFSGRIAGISGIVNGALESAARKEGWYWFFLVGLILGGAFYEYGLAPQPTPRSPLAPWAMIMGGLLVGIGTRLGNGCTSGHGVCGLGRLSGRSLVAVVTFLLTAMATVFIIRYGLSTLMPM